ncbi:MAG: hypothetical protein GTN67_05900 [Hydrotalea flava]|uniref:hypothetical protein n=1 Tax=Hydrotalea TaxID=1004300 RepID=UPI000945C6F8|nr:MULTISPECIES: hypothetical protein [Hydrotalea]MBX9837537.1 hypothetical protein [Silvanigrellaceae bacterium]NIM34968.1 hypothetical protein [Hydrotalea flava]NIM37794.1 hypothetical protein [Hydrotalea flava]NIN02963.1 hypothetical protein [Hydrotalea flava]NIN14648.1 hypothetical protein [Hydrotalea flava]
MTVGISVSIAISSFTYWKANAEKWQSILKSENLDRTTNIHNFNTFSVSVNSAGCRIGLGQLGAADVGGAISGAIDGAALGPGGALAGGVLGSSGASLGNLAGQVMGCLFSWW